MTTQKAPRGASSRAPQGIRSAVHNSNWLWWAANAAAAWPLVLMVWEYFAGTLGIDIDNAINNRTGRASVILLTASLACTPLHILFGRRQVLTLRKSLGLWAFLYAVLHLLNFIGLDYAFNVPQIFQDAILSKPYILAGLAALLLLIPLAVTSTRGWMRRLGRNWKLLHRLAYAAGVLAVLHFLWQAKAAERWEPMLYGLGLGLLLVIRIPRVRQAIVQTRNKLLPRSTAERHTSKSGAGELGPAQTARRAGVQRTPPAESPGEL